jgi:hypothetical protein
MKNKVTYLFLFLLVVLYGCESYYEPKIDEYPDVLVVEGMLTDQNDYALIKLTRSVSFNKSSYYRADRNAVVSIESESGISYPTSQIGAGLYQTKEKVLTQIGEGYYLKIATLSGEEYRSNIEKMVSPTPIDSIYLTDSTYQDITYSYYGDPIVNDYRGITFSVIPKEPSESSVGFLYKWNALVNYDVSTLYYPPDDKEFSSNLSYYCWKQMYSNLIYVYDYVHDGYINELPMADLHSLSLYSLSPLPIDSSRFDGTILKVNTSSFYYHLRQYTISKEGSKFWRSVKNQSEASGKLFDPVEEQVVGNIKCVSDSNKIAFGFFNIASFSDKVIGIELIFDGHKGVKKVSLMPVAESNEDCFLGYKPDFWY